MHKQYYYAYDCAGNRTGAQGDSSGTLGTGLTTNATKYSYNNLNELVAIAPGGPVTFAGTTVNPIKAASVNVAQVVTVGGTVTASDTVGIMVHDRGLSQARKVSYIVQSGDTTTSIATALRNKINSDSTLTALGISATSVTNAITISSQSSSATTYTAFVSNGATETASINDSKSAQVAISPSTAFSAKPGLASGPNSVAVTAVSGGGTKTSNGYSVTIASGSSSSLTYDDNGNLTSDGTNTYSWDAENRLIKITYPGTGNESQFSYDALGMNVKIVEVTAGSTTSTKQFVWCGSSRCEERDGSAALTRQFFNRGENISGTPYFFSKDQLGSVREMTNGSGSIAWQQSFDPYGIPTTIVGTTQADFGYAGLYTHSRSGLNLTVFRQYSSSLGLWLSRDPIGEMLGPNLYSFAGNSPVNNIDPLGLSWGPQDWRIDAMKHCVASCVLTHNHGKEFAKWVGDLWEAEGNKRGQTSPSSIMDQRNNAVGREIPEFNWEGCLLFCDRKYREGRLWGPNGPLVPIGPGAMSIPIPPYIPAVDFPTPFPPLPPPGGSKLC